MQIFVNIIGSTKTITLNVNETDTIADVKGKIKAKEGIPDDLNRLWFSGKWLDSGGSRIFQMGGRCFVANGGAHILFSGKKCMKLKEIGLKWGGARLLAPCYSKITIFL